MSSRDRSSSWLRAVLPAVLVVAWAWAIDAVPAAAQTSGTWSSLAGSGPPARKGHTAIYDAPRKRIILFGGEGQTLHGTTPADTLYNDVWVLNLCDTPTWSRLTTSGTPPSGREDHTAVYDPTNQRMIVFAGETGDGPSNLLSDVWALSLSGTPTWQQLSPGGAFVCPRSGQSASWDSPNGVMVAFGGNVAFSTSVIQSYDTYLLSSAASPSWTAYHCNEGSDCIPINGHICFDRPSPREYQSTVYDVLNFRTVLYAGWYEGFPAFSDTWAWQNGAWTQLSPSGSGPGPRENHRADYDSARHRMIVFGGDDGNPDGVTFYSTVHELSLPSGGTPAWTQLSPGGSSSPGARSFHSLVYDPVHDRCVVFGGVDANGVVLGDTWLLTFSNPSDATAPATTADLRISNLQGHNVQLSWTAPGDDGAGPCPATSYSVRMLAGSPITDANWDSATPISNPPTPGTPGTTQSMWTGNVSSGVFWYFAMRTSDEVPNQSGTSNNDCVKFTSTLIQLCSGDGGGLLTYQAPDGAAAPEFAIQRLQPNPTRSSARVSFSLPSAGAAAVELLDVAGRVVLSRDLGVLSAGTHDVDLAKGSALHAGYYLVRVRFGARRLVEPLVVLD